jgi:hypothetical protein
VRVELLKDGQVVDTVFTDAQALFEFANLEFGQYTIGFSKSGYRGKTVTVNLDQPLRVLDPITLYKIEDFPWWLIFISIIIVVIVILLLLLLLKRRKKKDEMDQSHNLTQSSVEDLEPQ